MNSCLLSLMATAMLAATGMAGPADSVLTNFITVRGDQLDDGGQPFRFISMNVPNLLLVEDNVAFTQENPWRLPDEFEIHDALATVAALGGTVARTYVISVQRPNDAPGTPRHVLAPGRFNEAAFRTLDAVLATANRTGVRLIIPLVDNWPWMGGRAEYAGFRGQTSDTFWTDPQLIADFKQTLQFILTRTNTITGVPYREDRAILCWETGNEIDSPAAWTREIAHYLKSLDTNHLVMDGFNASQLRAESLAIPDVDIVTTHHYPGQKQSFVKLIRANAAMARGKKPYLVGEFGFVSTAQMTETLHAIADSRVAGGLLWSLRFRNRDGGWYWHTEPMGANLYKAFHWPGSLLGEPYDELKLLAQVRATAFAIRGLPVPPVPCPAPPTLLPVTDAAAISWQGSVGATGYQVERAASRAGTWEIIATNVNEAFTQYRPQFADETAPAGQWFYRVRARNEAGCSEPSNECGPVTVNHATLVDELPNFSRLQSHHGGWRLTDRDCRAAKEDAHRLAGATGDTLIYQLPTGLQSCRVFTFFPKPNTENDLKISVSPDGRNFHAVPAQKTTFFHGAGDYGYWPPVLYQADNLGGTYLKIELTGETQLGRVEITHNLK